MSTLYDELGLNPRAADEEIHAAYRKLARQFHPDRNPGGETQAKERFQRIQQAFDVLSNPAKRAKYDETLGQARFAAGPLSLTTPIPEIKIKTGQLRRQKRLKSSVAFFFAAAAIVMMVVGLVLFKQDNSNDRLAAEVSQQSPSNKTPRRSGAAPSEQARRSPSVDLPGSLTLPSPPPGDGDKSTTSDERDNAHGETGTEPKASDESSSRFGNQAHNSSRTDEAEVRQPSPDGKSMVEEGTPSEADRLLIENMRQGLDAPTDAQQHLHRLLDELIDALNAGDKEKVTAAVKALRAADASISGVRPIVDQLMRVDGGFPDFERLEGVGKATAHAKALWVLGEAGTEADWILDNLLSMQKSVIEHDVQSVWTNDPIVIWHIALQYS